MSDWGNDPVVSGKSEHADWGNDPVVVHQAPAAPKPTAVSGLNPDAQLDIYGLPKTTGERQVERQGFGAQGSIGEVSEAATLFMPSGGAAKGIAGLVRAAPRAAEVISRLKPGAMNEAKSLVSGVGQVSDSSILGSKMHRDLTGKINKLVQERRAVASKLKGEYLSQGIAKEREIATAYRADLQQMLTEKARHLSPPQQKLIKDSFDHLGEDPSIERIETERRRLSDIASGQTEGYDSIQRIFAGGMAGNLRAKLIQAVPSAEKFFKTYAEMSEPINLFEDTALGRRITKGSSEFLPEQPYYNTSDLPKAFFKDKYTMGILKKLAGGDEKFVTGAAGEYAASALMDRGATEARAWLTKNKIWLDEVPQVRAEVERYVTNLEKVSHTREKAAKAVKLGVVGGVAAEGYHRLSNFMGW